MEEEKYLACEKRRVFFVMMFVGGFFGAFTYCLRGGVFCNAQTGNFVLMAMALGNQNYGHALYYLIPMSAYCAGAFFSEGLANVIKRFGAVRWDTFFIFLEICVVLVLGALPESAPYQITQVAINFICSMQYNTFRQARGVPMATTFCTNHTRQVGIHLYKAWHHRANNKKWKKDLKRVFSHFSMLLMFVAGGIISTALCNRFAGHALWFALIPLGFVFAVLLQADLVSEKGMLEQIPHGH
jgi:uncharacterized membrane protein YoaK (UPF0700 family)